MPLKLDCPECGAKQAVYLPSELFRWRCKRCGDEFEINNDPLRSVWLHAMRENDVYCPLCGGNHLVPACVNYNSTDWFCIDCLHWFVYEGRREVIAKGDVVVSL